jgi:hypothetical protein
VSRARRLAVLTAAVFLSSCAGRTEIVYLERPDPVVDESLQAPRVPVSVLTGSLERFLLAAEDGRPLDLLLAGDRFLAITPVDLVEVTSLRARGDVRAISLAVPGDCGGACRASLGEFLGVLRDDLASPSTLLAAVTADSPLESWPTLEIASVDRRWRVSFDETGKGLFVFELLTGVL